MVLKARRKWEQNNSPTPTHLVWEWLSRQPHRSSSLESRQEHIWEVEGTLLLARQTPSASWSNSQFQQMTLWSEGGSVPCKQRQRKSEGCVSAKESHLNPPLHTPSSPHCSTLKIIPLQWRLNFHSVFVSLILYCLFWSCGLPALLLSTVTAVCVCVWCRESTSERRVTVCFKYCYSKSPTHMKDKSLSNHIQRKSSEFK